MRPFHRLATATVALCAFSGCAVQRPAPAPAPPVPAAWSAPVPEGRSAALAAWWQQFDDPLLADLVEAAEVASPTLATARSRIAQARATRVAANASLLPGVDANASLQRANEPPLPLSTTLQGGFQTTWEIDLFGGNRAAAEAARTRLVAANAGWHDARASVAAETANAYFRTRTCQRLLAVAERDARSRAETARLSGLTERAGFTAPATAALARASAAEGSARVTQQRAQCEVDLKVLVALSGEIESALRRRMEGTWSGIPAAMAMGVARVPAELLAQRPDVYQAELEVAAASADVGAARAERFPKLSLSGAIAAGAVRLGGQTEQARTWSIGPLAMTLPVFDAGRRAANEDAAVARYEEAASLYAARVRQAVSEVEQALVNLDSARSRADDAKAAVEGYRASFTATEARWRSGLASLVELEDARRTLLAAETALAGLDGERAAAAVALYRALGGGWTRPAQEGTVSR